MYLRLQGRGIGLEFLSPGERDFASIERRRFNRRRLDVSARQPRQVEIGDVAVLGGVIMRVRVRQRDRFAFIRWVSRRYCRKGRYPRIRLASEAYSKKNSRAYAPSDPSFVADSSKPESAMVPKSSSSSNTIFARPFIRRPETPEVVTRA